MTHSGAVVGDAVEDENPVAIGIFREDFPAAEKRSIGSLHVEVLASSAGGGEARGGFADEIGCQLAANGVEERGSSDPSGYSSQERREEQQNQSDANQAAAHGAFIRYEKGVVGVRGMVEVSVSGGTPHPAVFS